MPIRLMIVAELRLDRDCFKLLFARQPEFELVGSGLLAPDIVESVALERSDVVVAVVDKAGGDTVGLVHRLARNRAVVVLGCRTAAIASRFLATPARGIVLAAQSPADAYAAVSAAARGESRLPPEEELASALIPPANGEDVLAALSKRERQVFALLVDGASNLVIAHRLGISVKTADTHRTHIFRKIGVHSVVHLVRFAAQRGLLDDVPRPAAAALPPETIAVAR